MKKSPAILLAHRNNDPERLKYTLPFFHFAARKCSADLYTPKPTEGFPVPYQHLPQAKRLLLKHSAVLIMSTSLLVLPATGNLFSQAAGRLLVVRKTGRRFDDDVQSDFDAARANLDHFDDIENWRQSQFEPDILLLGPNAVDVVSWSADEIHRHLAQPSLYSDGASEEQLLNARLSWHHPQLWDSGVKYCYEVSPNRKVASMHALILRLVAGQANSENLIDSATSMLRDQLSRNRR